VRSTNHELTLIISVVGVGIGERVLAGTVAHGVAKLALILIFQAFDRCDIGSWKKAQKYDEKMKTYNRIM
jgi:hypothetical protein